MLDPSADEIRAWGNSATELMTNYFGGLRDCKVYPDATSREIRNRLDSTLPKDGTGFDDLRRGARAFDVLAGIADPSYNCLSFYR